jgi:hypothetical protein
MAITEPHAFAMVLILSKSTEAGRFWTNTCTADMMTMFAINHGFPHWQLFFSNK